MLIWLGVLLPGLGSAMEYELIKRKAVAVTRRDKRRGGKYSVKEAKRPSIRHLIAAMALIPTTLEAGSRAAGRIQERGCQAQGAAHRRHPAMLPTVDHVKAEREPDFEIVSWQTNDAKGDMPDEFIAYCLGFGRSPNID